MREERMYQDYHFKDYLWTIYKSCFYFYMFYVREIISFHFMLYIVKKLLLNVCLQKFALHLLYGQRSVSNCRIPFIFCLMCSCSDMSLLQSGFYFVKIISPLCYLSVSITKMEAIVGMTRCHFSS